MVERSCARTDFPPDASSVGGVKMRPRTDTLGGGCIPPKPSHFLACWAEQRMHLKPNVQRLEGFVLSLGGANNLRGKAMG